MYFTLLLTSEKYSLLTRLGVAVDHLQHLICCVGVAVDPMLYVFCWAGVAADPMLYVFCWAGVAADPMLYVFCWVGVAVAVPNLFDGSGYRTPATYIVLVPKCEGFRSYLS